jgi:16S rRNA (guanine966-N2)-methyltransferase
MRITTGKYKGRTVIMPKGIRPTQDKVRKALFDILADVEGLSILELFAGSGAVGFEALSRGAREVTLAEIDSAAFESMKQTIQSLKLTGCSLLAKDAIEVIRRCYEHKKKFDIIFLDPPYYRGLAKKTLQTLSDYDILTPCGLIVVQHFKKDNLPDSAGDLALFKQSRYGDTVLSFYKKRCQPGTGTAGACPATR